MHKPALLALAAAVAVAALPRAARAQTQQDIARWKQEAQAVTITRDDWGIAHVHGHTDADAVFGMEYAQAEDDFHRVETNYLDALGWHAQAEGESWIWSDLRQRLFVNADSLKAEYAASPEWLRKLMDAFADGLNYYLYTHPNVKAEVITHFEPWMALSFTEGSIGGDIERVNLGQLAAFYGDSARRRGGGFRDEGEAPVWTEPTGSNGVAIAPKNTLDHHPLLYINPHTSFYFRSELQMSSDEGLDAYGAATWGQFFIYQGFNPTAGWMHTSSGVDNIDEFLETVTKKGDRYVYKHGDRELPVRTEKITVPYKTANGMGARTFTAYFTMHGPVERKIGDKWVTISLMKDHIHALIQSYSRTKARDYAAWRKIMELHTNSSNNTIFADAEGNIAYFHSNYIPRRDTSFNWNEPVDGSNPATDYHGLLSISETPGLLNPPSGWLYNSNNWPWSAAGPGDSPKRSDYPAYVERGTEEAPRGYHALKVLPGKHDYTMESLTAAMFDSYLPSFAHMMPSLIKAYDATPAADPLRARVADQIQILRDWDYRFGINSVATSLANFWGENVQQRVAREARSAHMSPEDYVADRATPQELLQSLAEASDKLTADFGTWQTPWGDINRFQRFNDDIDPRFDDSKPSIPVPFTSSRWGSLASFGARAYANTKKWYGTSGNSFVAVVEFGKDSVRARAVTAGGESGDPSSPHFNDEAERYATGNLRVVYFYPSQLVGHTERVYHPGQ
ncbi:MAG: penicillin acylase family protein [Gemmatimonadota bacterium]|nr:penicillin acylase family protein [Gemmatimonadota bacterium]